MNSSRTSHLLWAVLTCWALATGSLAAATPAVLNKPEITIKREIPDAMRDGRPAAEAVAGAERVAGADPKNFRAWYQLGLAYGADKRPEKAMEALRKALALRPQSAEAWHHLGANLWDSNEFTEAATAFRKAVKIDPKYAEAWNGLAVTANQLEIKDESFQAMEKAQKLSVESAYLWNSQGVILLRMREWQKALSVFNRAVELDPTYVRAWYNRGLTFSTVQDFANSADSFRRAIGVDPTYVPARLKLIGTMLVTGDWKKAQDILDETIHMYPRDGVVWAGIGFVYLNQELWDEAETAYRKAIEYGAEMEINRTILAAILMKKGLPDKAEEELQTNLRAKPDHAQTLGQLARLRESQQRLPEARELARKALAIQQNDIALWVDFARYCRLTQQWGEAEQTGARITELVPGEANGWIWLGEAQEAQNKKAQSEAAFRKAVKLNPQQATGWAGLARVLEDPAEAVEAGEKAVKSDPKSGSTHLALGEALIRKAKDDPARPEFTRALESFAKATELAPHDKSAWKSLQSCQARLGRKVDAAASGAKLAALGGSGAEILAAGSAAALDTFDGCLAAARPLLAAGRVTEGLPLLQRASDMRPEDFDLTAKVVEALQALNRQQDAIDYAQKVRDRFPNKAGAWLTVGSSLIKSPRADQAQAAVQKAIDLEPDNPMSWYAMAWTHYTAGRFYSAIPRAFHAVELAPENVRCWQLLVSCWVSAREFAGGESKVREWLENHPDSAVAWRSLGALQLAGSKYNEAVESCFKAVNLKTDDVDAWSILGSAYVNLQNGVGALDAFDHALRIDPNHSEACTSLAWIRFVNGQFPDAIELLNRALTNDPQNKRTLAILTRALYREGEDTRARNAYDRLKTIDAAYAEKVRLEAPGEFPQ